MAASHPESARRALFRFAVILGLGIPASASAQVPAEPVLRGRAFVGDTAMSSGTVVLHHIAADTQGEIDSARVATDGGFSFRLPTVPDPGRSEVYFASVRHAGILYFGSPINTAIQLDSLYEIHTYDTLVAPAGGMALPLEVRNLFLEGADTAWQVTDLFQVRNDEPRTLVSPEGGFIWRYPLPASARNAEVAPSEFATGAASVEDGHLVIRTPLPPGGRLFVIRYTVPDPFIDLPLPGSVETLELLVREPAPPFDIPGLVALDRVELEPGTTYRRYNATGLRDADVEIVRGEEERAQPVRWFAVILGLTLGAVAVWAIQRGRSVRPPQIAEDPQATRRALILQVARLDETFAADPHAGPEARGAYEARRAELLRRIRGLS